MAMALILVATVAVTTAFAADIRILGANPVQEGLHRIAEQFKRDTAVAWSVHDSHAAGRDEAANSERRDFKKLPS